MANIQMTVLPDGTVVDSTALILEELKRANASPDTLNQQLQFTSDVRALSTIAKPVPDDPGSPSQTIPVSPPMSAFIKQYIADVGGARYGPGFSTIAGRVDNRYQTVYGALTAQEAISIIGLAGYRSTPGAIVTPGNPPAISVGLPPPLGGTPLIYNANMPAFVGGDLGTIILSRSAPEDPGGTLSQIILGTNDASLPQVRMTGDWQQEQQEDY